jgi:hypothetical protein
MNEQPDRLPMLPLPRGVPCTAIPVLAEIAAERERQVAKGFDAGRDDWKSMDGWHRLIRDRLCRAEDAVISENRRRQFVVIAALACAAVEAFDAASRHDDADARPCDTEAKP